MKKRVIAVLGTVTTLSLIAVGAWMIFRPGAAGAAESEWLTDMQKAQEIAAKEKKDLLINFTGSDWCGWCIRLKDEVFSKEEFEKAREDFVLVEMDFPSDESIVPAKTREQNELWSNRFSIEGFPTIVLTDAQGRPYGSLGYVPGGPTEFLSELDKQQKVRTSRDEQLAKSKIAQGVEKAKLLASALEAVPEQYHLPMYRAEVEEIISLDADDKSGLKSRFTRTLQQSDAEDFLKKLQQEVQVAYGKEGEDAALKLVQDAFKSQDAKDNPVLRGNLAQSEVQLLVTFEKSKEALARLETLTKDESFTQEERRTLRERQATLLKDAGETEKALKALDALLAEAQDAPDRQLAYLTEKAEVLSAADRPQDALAVYESALKKTEKGTNQWLAVQFNRGDLLKKDKKAKEAGGVFDEMLTVEELAPVQKAMLLVYAAESYHEAENEKETATRVEKADKILAELKKSEEVPPQYLEQFEERLKAVRKGEKPAEDKPSEDKPAADKPEAEKE